MLLDSEWKFNVVGLYNYKKSGKLEGYFDFIKKYHNQLEGDICEVGVYRGFSILATALLLKELGSDKKVWGFDSFSGFPSYHKNDDLSKFEDLYANGFISESHFQDYRLNIQLKEFMSGQSVSPSTISSSMDFSETSLSLLKSKIKYFGLDNIILVDGDYKDTMTQKTHTNAKFMSALIDCDLYESHKISLPFVWDRMPIGGYLFLDEYYSLKFPGARIATNEFFSNKLDKPEMYPRKPMDFERWFVKKNSE
jgi:hypothetical protein